MKNLDTYDITDYRRMEYFEKDAAKMLQLLLENIKTGIGLFEMGSTVRALYLNPAYFECIGYSKENYESVHDDVFSTLYPEDVPEFMVYVREQIAKMAALEYNIRGYRHDGSLGWFSIKGIPIENQDWVNPVYLAVVTDISDTMNKRENEKKLQKASEELETQQERYRVLEATAPGIFFEYFPDKDKMVFSYNLPNNKKRKEVEHYQQYLKEFPMVHSDHIASFKEALMACCQKENEGDLEYLSTVSGGGYRWHTTHYKSVAGNDGKVISVMGRICDIHDAKMEKERINYQAERDGLTNVYHKNVAFEKMEEYVKEAPFAKFYFTILDLDNFKQINDQYGHQHGDMVIKETANHLQNTFAEDSIIGRFGGDEFVILTKNISRAEVSRRLERIKAQVRFSAGIVEWKYGDAIDRVFEKADKAMYEAKNNGKNGIHFK